MRRKLVVSSGVSAFNYSGLSSVIFQDLLYVFYSGVGEDGAWYATLDQKSDHWSGPFSCLAGGASGMGIAEYTSPCSVVFNGSLYLFFNGAGHDGTYWTQTSDGTNWTAIASVSQNMGKREETFGSRTSPSATVYRDDLYLFWNNSGNDGVRYSYLSNRSSLFASPMDVTTRVGIRRQTSTAAVTFGDSIYLFYNGSGHDGTWVATLTSGIWSPMTHSVGGNYLDYTSPAAYVSGDGLQLSVLWNGYTDDGIFYAATQDGEHWTKQISLRRSIDGMGILTNSSPTGISFNGIPYMFWIGTNGQLWFSQGLTIPIDGHPNLDPILRALLSNDDFVLTSHDSEFVQHLLESFDLGANPISGPSYDAPHLKGGQRMLQGKGWKFWKPATNTFSRSPRPLQALGFVVSGVVGFAVHKGYDVTLYIRDVVYLSFTKSQSGGGPDEL
jgi:hypothetical protein